MPDLNLPASPPPPVGPPTAPPSETRSRLAATLTVDALLLVACAYWALAGNRSFLSAALADRAAGDLSTWVFGASLLLIVLALHVLLLGPLVNRWTAKPIIGAVTLAAAAASYYTGAFGVYLDPAMLRNVLRTDVAEARELLSLPWALHMLLFGGLPLLLLWRVRLRLHGWKRSVGGRLLTLTAAALVGVGLLLLHFQPMASLMRTQKELRYLITPVNVLWSTGKVLADDSRSAVQPREAIGLDAQPGPSWGERRKPLVVVLVVGETARAADWGLNIGLNRGLDSPTSGDRQTTPQLAALMAEDPRLHNFPRVSACGTSTEVSLPCLFAPVGRRQYDEARIRRQESLLHVVARAGVDVQWLDNQSGCKGVCDGVPGLVQRFVSPESAPAYCAGAAAEGDPELKGKGADKGTGKGANKAGAQRCLDEGLVHDLDARLAAALKGGSGAHPGAASDRPGTHLWVLHMLGNHGPSYFRRHPADMAPFQPECREDDLRRCTPQEIVNAYDNAVHYTDHVLARALRTLRSRAGEVDSALVYVSDHGESLGERNLYLHGMPYAIAPEVQLRVPMVLWTSAGLAPAAGLIGRTPGAGGPEGCLQPSLAQQTRQEIAHDHLFHTVLGLLDVRTALYEPSLDLVGPCRRSSL